MSIIIKDMEMPHNCFLCPLSIMNGERLYCEVKKDEVLRAKIAQDCPLIEIPPHGDLIDLDKLLAEYPSILDNYIGLTGRSKIPVVIEADKIKETEYYIYPCHCHAKRQPYWQRFRSIYRLKCPCCQLTIEADSKEEAICGWNDIQKEFGNSGNIRRLLN